MFDGYSSIIETYIVQWQGLGCSGHQPGMLLLFHQISLYFKQRQYNSLFYLCLVVNILLPLN